MLEGIEQLLTHIETTHVLVAVKVIEPLADEDQQL
jgi:hypothetical protein